MLMQCDVPTLVYILNVTSLCQVSEPFGFRTTDVRVNNEVMMINRYLNVKDAMMGTHFLKKKNTRLCLYSYVKKLYHELKSK